MNEHDKIAKPKQLNLKDPEVYELADKLARLHGESKSSAVKTALREKLERDERQKGAEERYRRMMSIVERYCALPTKDTRTADEILGYDENGLPR